MKNRYFICVFFAFLACTNTLFAFGKKQAEESEPVNTQWNLCITAFDTSSMSPAWQTAGDTAARSIAAAMQNLNFRFREEDETFYYRDYAWAKSRALVYDSLLKKRDERDLIIFRGDPSWKFTKDLKAVEKAIEALEKQLEEIDALAPVVEEMPVFSLTEKNISGTFPAAPDRGGEYSFCVSEKADAFITGNLTEYYGRIYLELKMYTRYTGSYSYENSILYSTEDFNNAIDEISTHLAVAVSVKYPSAILVRSTPPDTMVLIDGAYMGQGEIEKRTHSPGTVEIDVLADQHVPISIPLELSSGELADIFVELTPLGLTILNVNVPEKPESKVFLGGLYVGETPLALEIPTSEFSYISIETPDGDVGSVILRDNSLVKGNAFLFRENETVKADFLTAAPITKEERRAENSRKSFYKAYGAFWIILPIALLAGGIAGTYIAANDFGVSNNQYGYDAETRDRMSSNANTGTILQYASYGLIGASLGISFYQIYRYLKNSSWESTPITRKITNNEE